jgi:hypothetical protein
MLIEVAATCLSSWQLSCCPNSSGLIPRWDGKGVSISLAHTNIPSTAITISICILLTILSAASGE